ncbi:hypothetical protein F2P79_024938 [Pimephales promelas]|nr:hypothetical protein F2P79_024938 [Pimephales promelas]
MALFALQQKYGQPHQLVLREIKAILALPRQLLSKLPTEHVTNFARYARTILKGQSYNLISFSAWLQEEAECQAMADQRRFRHLRDLPLPAFSNGQPLVLIGADYPHLINPIDQVYFGPPKSPAAIQTRLGWVLQGPIPIPNTDETQCLFTIANPLEELRHDVEKLWKVDILPFRNEKVITRSKQDQAAMELLASKSKKVDVDVNFFLVHSWALPYLVSYSGFVSAQWPLVGI